MADPPEVSAAVDICNLAFLKLGIRAIADFDEDNQRARIAKGTYASIRNDVLRSHPWNFALKFHQLTPGVMPAGAWDFDLAFDIPPTSLAVHAVEGQTAQEGDEWRVVGRQILTNLAAGTAASPTLNVQTIERITDVTKYDASFIEHLSERLQAEWAEPLRAATTLAEAKVELAAAKGRSAMSADGRESTPRPTEASTFLNAR
jgi:hypothetical protein